MTFKEATKKLRRIAKKANEEYIAIDYGLTHMDSKIHAVECRLYINGFGSGTGSTWEKAFKALQDIMYPKKVILNTKEAPK